VNIHFLRHAKTNQKSPTGRDFDRELLVRGLEQLEEFRAFIGSKQLDIPHIYCSSAVRTRQTLSHISSLFPTSFITYHDALYLASANEILRFINEKDTTEDVLVIGHNEGLSDLISYLTDQELHMKTCAYIQLSFPFERSSFISKGTGELKEVFRVI
jgi:phosphohistidine phosphatase